MSAEDKALTVVLKARAAWDEQETSADELAILQGKLGAWQARNFGYQPVERMVLGVSEEAGELAHAQLKHLQGIRGMGDPVKYKAAIADALADIAIYSMQIAQALRLDYHTLISETAKHVLERDWKKSPDKPTEV